MRVEVLGGIERRRRWSHDDKMRIVEETLVPGAKVTESAPTERFRQSAVWGHEDFHLSTHSRNASAPGAILIRPILQANWSLSLFSSEMAAPN
jgi:hypothetical protein